MVILQEPKDRGLSKAEKAIKDLLNSSPIVDVYLSDWSLWIELENGKELQIDIDQLDWSRYELRVEIENE